MIASKDHVQKKFEEALGPVLDLEKNDGGQYISWETLKAYSYFIKGWTLAEQNKVQ